MRMSAKDYVSTEITIHMSQKEAYELTNELEHIHDFGLVMSNSLIAFIKNLNQISKKSIG